MSEFNDRVIGQYRASGGLVEGFGNRLVLLHSVGAKSGVERVNPALSLRDAGAWYVIASAMGAEKNPGWYHNLVAHPDISIEAGAETVNVTAQELDGEDYAAAYARFQRASAAFDQYQDRARKRRLPIFRLARR